MVEKTAQCAVFFEWIVAFGRSKGQCHHFAMTNEQLTMNNEQLASFGRSKGFLDSLRAPELPPVLR